MKHIIFVSMALALAACSFDPGGIPATDAPDGGDDLADAGTDADDGLDADPGTPDSGSPSPDGTVDCPVGQVLTQDGCQLIPKITCSLHSFSELRLRFEGYLAAGFLGTATEGATPVAIAYGSDFDSSGVMSTCPDLWAVPYPSGCTIKPLAAWTGGEPATVDLVISKTVENLNVALVYDDGSYRWGDLTESDPVNPDPDGFAVSGSGSGYSCHIHHDGVGGVIKIAP